MKLFKTNNGSVDTIIANYAATGCRMTTVAFSRQNDAGSRVELRKSRYSSTLSSLNRKVFIVKVQRNF